MKLSMQLVREVQTVFAAWLWETEHWHFLQTPSAVDKWDFLKMLLPIGRNCQAKQTPWKIPFQEAKEELWPFSHLKINRSPVFLMISLLFASGFFVWRWFGGGFSFVCLGSLFLKYLCKNQEPATGIQLLFPLKVFSVCLQNRQLSHQQCRSDCPANLTTWRNVVSKGQKVIVASFTSEDYQAAFIMISGLFYFCVFKRTKPHLSHNKYIKWIKVFVKQFITKIKRHQQAIKSHLYSIFPWEFSAQLPFYINHRFSSLAGKEIRVSYSRAKLIQMSKPATSSDTGCYQICFIFLFSMGRRNLRPQYFSLLGFRVSPQESLLSKHFAL